MKMPEMSTPWWVTEARHQAGIGKGPRRPMPVVPVKAKPAAVLQPEDRKGLAWTDAEVSLLRQHFDTGRSLSDMAALHGRSHGAITSRLSKMGLIEYHQGLEVHVRLDGTHLE